MGRADERRSRPAIGEIPAPGLEGICGSGLFTESFAQHGMQAETGLRQDMPERSWRGEHIEGVVDVNDAAFAITNKHG